MKVLPTVKKNKTFEHVQVLMYHKKKVLMRMSNIKHLLGVGMMLLPQF
jgi:hypothetical protein